MSARSSRADPAAVARAADEAAQVEAWVRAGKVRVLAPDPALRPSTSETLAPEARATVERIAADRAKATELHREAEERLAEAAALLQSALRDQADLIVLEIKRRRRFRQSDESILKEIIAELGEYERHGYRVEGVSDTPPPHPLRAALWAIIKAGPFPPRSVYGMRKFLDRHARNWRGP